MNKLFSRGRRAVADLRYHLDNFFTRGVSAQFTILFVLMLALVVAGTVSLSLGLYQPGNKDVPSIGHKYGEGFWDAAWWSLMHIFDPSYVSQDYGANAAVVILALVVSMLGLVLFGGVIGLVSAAVERKLDELAGGDRPVRESGHLLVLGWNEKIFSILDLFEDYHRPIKVVILSNHAIPDMQEMLRTRRSRVRRIKPVLRTGSPTNLGELERMAFRDAYSIIVLADESHTNPDEEPDLLTIKTVMLLASHVGPPPHRPKMVAELLRREHLEVAHIASHRAVSFVCSSEVLSRMIVQSARQPGLSRVYVTLFGFAGNEIYVQAHREGVGRRFGDLMFDYPNAVVIGTSSTEQRNGEAFFHQHMNPGSDHVVGDAEWLILIADGEHIIRHPDALPPPDAEPIAIPAREFLREHVLILGWNSNIYTVLREYDSFLQAGSEITIAAHHTPDAARAWLDEELTHPLTNATINYVQTDYALAARLDALLVRRPDTCIILADESSGERDPDARTIVAILLLQDFESRTGRRFKQVVAEVLSAANAELLQQHGSTETIISPQLISMLLAQISQQLMLDRVYADLMNARANEIYLKDVSRYTNRPAECTFADLMRAASTLGELAIGVKIHADAEDPTKEFGVRVNPRKREPLGLLENDKVIVISSGGRNITLS